MWSCTGLRQQLLGIAQSLQPLRVIVQKGANLSLALFSSSKFLMALSARSLCSAGGPVRKPPLCNLCADRWPHKRNKDLWWAFSASASFLNCCQGLSSSFNVVLVPSVFLEVQDTAQALWTRYLRHTKRIKTWSPPGTPPAAPPCATEQKPAEPVPVFVQLFIQIQQR